MKSLANVSFLTSTPYVLITSSSGPHKSLNELVQASKKPNSTLTFGSAGIGSSTHLASEYLHQMTGMKNSTHIPYKSSPEVIQDVLAGRVDYFLAPFETAAPYIANGKLISLGISSKEKLNQFPQFATIAEQGYANFDIEFWVGIWAPIDVPPEILKKINQDINKAMQDPEMDQQQFHQFVQNEMSKYAKIVKQAGITQN